MSNDPLQSYAKSCLGRTALSLFLTFGAFLVCGGLMAGIALIPERWIDRDTKPLLLLGAGGCLVMVGLAGGVTWALIANQRISAQFDEAFIPFGLTRSRYGLSGLQYSGTYRGRQVNVLYYVSGGRHLRTPNLTLYLGGHFRTRLGIGTKNVLSSLGGAILAQTPLSLDDPAYDGLVIYPLDEAWSRRLLADPQARDGVVRLVGKETPGVRGLAFGPDAVRLQLRHFSLGLVTSEAVRQWMQDLSALAEIAEGLPPPQQTAEASEWERTSRTNPGQFLLLAVAVVGVLVMCLITTMSLALVFWLGASS